MVVLVAYSAWVYPFEIAFMNASPRGGLFIVDSIIDLFFAADIVLTFFVAYIDSRTHLLVRDPKKIAIRYAYINFKVSFIIIIITNYMLVVRINIVRWWYMFCWSNKVRCSLSFYVCTCSIFRYLSTFFVMDVASTLPFEVLGYLITGRNKAGLSYSLLGMLRLWRLRKVKQLFTR